MTDTTPAKPKPFKLTAPRVPEAMVQRGIVAVLQHAGYFVMPLGQTKKPSRCPKCGTTHWGQQATQNPVGCPDLIISHAAWPKNTHHALEVKGEGTRRRPEQIALTAAGFSAFVTSSDEAARDVIAFELSLGLTPNRALVAWLAQSSGPPCTTDGLTDGDGITHADGWHL